MLRSGRRSSGLFTDLPVLIAAKLSYVHNNDHIS